MSETYLKRQRAKRILRVANSDGQQYWQVPIPRWWLETFGWGELRGGLWSRFWEQRRRRKQRTAIGKSLDRIAGMYSIDRQFLESDASLRERILRQIGNPPWRKQ